MRLHKVVNRVYGGVTYYRWVVTLPPKRVRELGWANGQELEVAVRGSTLWIQPSTRQFQERRERGATLLEAEVRRRTMGRR